MPAGATRRLQGRTVIVTGAASGIGAACARRYAAEGAHVAIGDIDIEAASRVAGEIDGIALRCDHTRTADCEALAQAAIARWGSIDALHNNAGTGWTGRFETLTAADAERLMRVLVLGPVFMTQACLPALRLSKVASGGAILFTASGLGVHGRPMISMYSAAKHAIVGLMRSLALELGPEGLRVNAVCPGVVDTPLMRATTGAWGQPEAVFEQFRGGTPLRRIATPEDIAASAAFLLSDDAANLTATALLVDGGAHEA